MTRWLLCAALVACGGARPLPTEPVVALDPAPGAAPGSFADATAIAEAGDTIYVFGPDGVRVIAGGAITASAARPFGGGAATLTAPDGGGAWIVGIDHDGHVLRVGAGGELDDVGDRLGLPADAVAAVATAGALAAFALADGVAWTDLAHPSRALAIVRHAARYRVITASGTRFAGLGAEGIDVWDPGTGHVLAYRVPGARAIAFAGDRLAVATDRALYLETGGRLAPFVLPRLPDPPASPIASPVEIDALAASPAPDGTLWIAAGGALYALHGDELRLATGVRVAAGARLFPSSRGVWIASGPTLAHVVPDTIADRDARAWTQSIAPVVGRVCARCHLPGGSANVDLSTFAGWTAHAGAIRHRVLDTETMPPPGTALPDADRDAIRRWLAAH